MIQYESPNFVGLTESARPENTDRPKHEGENAGPENDGPSKYRVVKMQDLKTQDLELQDYFVLSVTAKFKFF